MQSQDIEYYLSALGERLEELHPQETFRLLMVGGGFMLTQVGNRLSTEDIDVQIKNIEHIFYSGDYNLFKEAIRFVAHDMHINEEWLSDTVSDFLALAGPVPYGQLWRSFGSWLEIYIPPKEYVLAHKLVAGRRKDLDDIKALLRDLRIDNRRKAQKIVDRYVKNRTVKKSSKVQEMLDLYFGPK